MTAPNLSENQSSVPPTNEPPTASAPATGGWQPPASAPEWAKDPAKLYEAAMTMYQVLGQSQAGGPPAPTAGSTPPPPLPPALPTNEDWVQRPNEAAEMVARAQMASFGQTLQQNLQAQAQQNASTIRALAQSQYAGDFQRWGPEINGHLAQIPMERLTLDNIEKVVKFVRGNHVDEIAQEKARQLLATGALGERSTGANGVPVGTNGLEMQKLPGEYKALMEKHGLTESQVRDFCHKNGMSLEQWVGQIAENKMFTSASPFQSMMSDEKLGIKRTFE